MMMDMKPKHFFQAFMVCLMLAAALSGVARSALNKDFTGCDDPQTGVTHSGYRAYRSPGHFLTAYDKLNTTYFDLGVHAYGCDIRDDSVRYNDALNWGAVGISLVFGGLVLWGSYKNNIIEYNFKVHIAFMLVSVTASLIVIWLWVTDSAQISYVEKDNGDAISTELKHEFSVLNAFIVTALAFPLVAIVVATHLKKDVNEESVIRGISDYTGIPESNTGFLAHLFIYLLILGSTVAALAAYMELVELDEDNHLTHKAFGHHHILLVSVIFGFIYFVIASLQMVTVYCHQQESTIAVRNVVWLSGMCYPFIQLFALWSLMQAGFAADPAEARVSAQSLRETSQTLVEGRLRVSLSWFITTNLVMYVVYCVFYMMAHVTRVGANLGLVQRGQSSMEMTTKMSASY